MKKKIFSFALIVSLVLLAPLNFNRAEAATSSSSAGYVTNNYDVTIDVGEDNVLHVTEKIDVNFTISSRGIYRYIPYESNVTKAVNGVIETKKYFNTIKNVKVTGHEYKTYKEDNQLVIRIGDPKKYLKGNQSYTISYDYKIEKDSDKTKDELYFNFIPYDWQSTITNSSVTIHMPKSFDKSQFAIIATGSDRDDAYTTTFSGNTIVAKSKIALENRDGATIMMNLPEGYFSKATTYSTNDYIPLIAIGISLALAILIILRRGFPKKPIPVIEYLPPDGFTPAELGYLIDLRSDNRDVISMIIYWADKGYLTIEDNGAKNIKLHKKGDLPGGATSQYQRYLFNSLFHSGDSVSLSSLDGKFADKLQHAKGLLEGAVKKKAKISFKTANMTMMNMLAYLCIFVPIVAMAVYSYFNTMVSGFYAGILLVIVLSVTILLYLLARSSYYKNNGAVTVITTLVAGAAVTGLFYLYSGMTYTSATLCVITGIATVVNIFLATHANIYSDEYLLLLGRIIGFRDFLENAEKDKLNELVEEYPQYFYNILPYAYALGVSDKWAKNFEGIATPQPDWYTGRSWSTFDTYIFMRTFDRSMSHMTRNLATPDIPVNSGGRGSGGGFSGGGSFGGGFSGGGFGGGGGGRW